MTAQIPDSNPPEPRDPRLLYGRPSEPQTAVYGRRIATPLSKFGWPSWLVYLLGVLALLYVLNLGSGIFLDALPDNLPFIGNLDEGLAYLFLWSALVEFLESRRLRRAARQAGPPLAH